MPFILKIITSVIGLLLAMGGLNCQHGKDAQSIITFICYVICHTMIILGLVFIPWINL